jgi:glycosyltransferase involved in cell wall biosynthesis
MKVLFVAQYAPHREKKIPIHVQSQMDSLIKNNIDVIPYPFHQNGIFDKIKSYIKLKRFLKSNRFDIIHCHFSYIGLAGLLASKEKNVIVSFMGTDLENILTDQSQFTVKISNLLTKYLINRSNSLKGIIVKNQKHYKFLSSKVKCPIINLPNGVDIDKFYPIDINIARKKIGYNINKPLVIFCTAKNNNPIKNIDLANKSIDILKEKINVEFKVLSQLNHDQLLLYYNSADVLLLTSLSEGSPNVIKEAMACNLPIVATNVGDISERIKDDENSHVANFDSIEIAECIYKVILTNQRSKGREILINDKIDNTSIANKLIEFYN